MTFLKIYIMLTLHDSHKATNRFLKYFLYILNRNLTELASLHLVSIFKIPVIDVDNQEDIENTVDLWTTIFILYEAQVTRVSNRSIKIEFPDHCKKTEIYELLQSWFDEICSATKKNVTFCKIRLPDSHQFIHKTIFTNYGFDLINTELLWHQNILHSQTAY